VKRYPMYVNGQFVPARSGKWFPVYDPSTEEVIAEAPDSNAEDVDAAVNAAREAFESGTWGKTTAQERGRVLFRLAEKLRAETAALAELETRNTGKPIVEAEYDIADAATCFEYYGGLATKVMGQVNPVPANALSLSLREPVGVAGQIIPWNYPLLMAAWKLAPALAAGCTCVLKPAEQTPLTALEFAQWFEEAGLPAGTVNVVTGFGETAGAPLATHREVNKVAFTGSVEVGKRIARAAADSLKRVTLELGGKSPNIFFADADFEAAIDGALFGVFINQGEVCSAGSRILVERPIYEKFVEAVAAKAKTIRVVRGNGEERGEAVRRRRAPQGTHAGVLRGADDFRGRAEHGAHCARGDFWSGGGRDSICQRGGGRAHCQRHELRAGGGGVDAGHF
jgi:betaine-aldehyde dehydrogenase